MKVRERKQFIWPAAGIVLGTLASMNRFYQPHITLQGAIAVWFAAIALALLLSVHPVAARLGTLLVGLCLAVPCFLRESALIRGLMMCSMALPLVIVTVSSLAPSSATYRERMAYMFTWLGTRELKRHARNFDLRSLVHFIAGTTVLAAAMACVKATPAAGAWLLARWLAGGIMILAWAEMLTAAHDFLSAALGLSAPALMRSPHLSTSLSEFWTKRWNPAASLLVFRTFLFTPLARRGAALALCAAFLVSALGHVAIPYMATGALGISLACGAFFLVQPLLIAAERWMNVRHWRPTPARFWTLTALTLVSPLFVEPVLQIAEPDWGPPYDVLAPTLAILVFVIALNGFYLLGSLAACPGPAQANEASTTITKM